MVHHAVIPGTTGSVTRRHFLGLGGGALLAPYMSRVARGGAGDDVAGRLRKAACAS